MYRTYTQAGATLLIDTDIAIDIGITLPIVTLPGSPDPRRMT